MDVYRGLLWQTGRERLEAVVRKALALLGIEAAPDPPVDLKYEFDDQILLIEIEGSEGPIQVRKGRQLMHYITDLEGYEPSKIHGAIVGNPYRLEHPSNRPPAGGREGLYSRPLANMAGSRGWALLTTVELFELVNRHLNGDPQAPHELRRKLGLPD